MLLILPLTKNLDQLTAINYPKQITNLLTKPVLLFKMVKLLNLSVAAVALLTPIAEARDCTKGLKYCGYVLLKVGKYRHRNWDL